MNRRQIGTKLTLDALGIDLTDALDAFSGSLVIQKAIYLAQAAGINLGYFYHWYLRGPYCSGLTADVFDMADELVEGLNDAQGWTFDPASQSNIRRLKNLLGEFGNNARQLELLASVHFLIARRQVNPDDVNGLHATLQRFNKRYSIEETEAAFQSLVRNELIGV